MFWRPTSMSRHKPEGSTHIWFPKSRVILSSHLPTYPSNNHTREGKRKNLGVVQFLAPDLLDSHPLGLPWAWQVCQHPEKYRKSDSVDTAPTYLHPLPGIQLSHIRAPGLEDWTTDHESEGSRDTMRQPKLQLCFLHPVSPPTCWQQLPSSFHCSRKVPAPGPFAHAAVGALGNLKLFRVEL